MLNIVRYALWDASQQAALRRLAWRWYDSPRQAERAISCFFFKALIFSKMS
jgi:hypothetical protein